MNKQRKVLITTTYNELGIIIDTKAEKVEQPVTVWRVEDPVKKHGLWRNFDGSPADTFDKLTEGKCRAMPMEDNDFYRADGKHWFAATDTPEKLKEWFSVLDIVQLRRMGQNVYMFEVKGIRKVSDYEVVFAREDIIRQIQIDPKSIWENFDDVLKKDIVQG